MLVGFGGCCCDCGFAVVDRHRFCTKNGAAARLRSPPSHDCPRRPTLEQRLARHPLQWMLPRHPSRATRHTLGARRTAWSDPAQNNLATRPAEKKWQSQQHPLRNGVALKGKILVLPGYESKVSVSSSLDNLSDDRTTPSLTTRTKTGLARFIVGQKEEAGVSESDLAYRSLFKA